MVAERARISRASLWKVEKGEPSVAMGIYAAVLHALNNLNKDLLLVARDDVPATYMAASLYMGAGFGVGIMYLFHIKKENKTDRLTKKDLPYTISMIILDILAPIFLMLGISIGSASNVSRELWTAIVLITFSSILLSFEGSESFQFSYGSLFVILATLCWGLENIFYQQCYWAL